MNNKKLIIDTNPDAFGKQEGRWDVEKFNKEIDIMNVLAHYAPNTNYSYWCYASRHKKTSLRGRCWGCGRVGTMVVTSNPNASNFDDAKWQQFQKGIFKCFHSGCGITGNALQMAVSLSGRNVSEILSDARNGIIK